MLLSRPDLLDAALAGAIGIGFGAFGRLRRTISAPVLALAVVVAFVAADKVPRGVTIEPGLVAATAVLALLAASTGVTLARRWPAPVVLVAFVISLGGMWAGVPENDHIVLLGALLTGLGVAAGRATLTATATVGCVALLGGAAVVGGVGRTLPTVGGLLCFALLWALPIGAALRRRRLAVGRAAALPLATAHIVVAAVSARWIASSSEATWTRVGIVAALSVAAAAALLGRSSD